MSAVTVAVMPEIRYGQAHRALVVHGAVHGELYRRLAEVGRDVRVKGAAALRELRAELDGGGERLLLRAAGREDTYYKYKNDQKSRKTPQETTPLFQ